MNKEEVVKLAKECGAVELGDQSHFDGDKWIDDPRLVLRGDRLLAFANACEKIGMEKAAKICEERIDVWTKRNKFRPAELADMADTELQSAADAIRTEIK